MLSLHIGKLTYLDYYIGAHHRAQCTSGAFALIGNHDRGIAPAVHLIFINHQYFPRAGLDTQTTALTLIYAKCNHTIHSNPTVSGPLLCLFALLLWYKYP